MTSEHRAPGSALGEYVLEELLGEGTTGVVYRARHARSGSVGALNVLHAASMDDAEFLVRLENRASFLAANRHPVLVPVSPPRNNGGVLCVAAPYLEGESLEALVLREGPLQVEPLLTLLRPIGDAVAHLHGQGRLHRALVPSHVLKTRSPQGTLAPRLLPGSVLCQVGDTTASLVGVSPELAYIARELPRLDLDPTVDLRGLGELLWWCLTGRPLEADEDEGTVRSSDLMARALRTSSLHPAVEAVVLRATTRDRTAQFPTVTALLDAVARAAQANRPGRASQPPPARTSQPPPPAAPAPAPAPAASPARPSRPPTGFGPPVEPLDIGARTVAMAPGTPLHPAFVPPPKVTLAPGEGAFSRDALPTAPAPAPEVGASTVLRAPEAFFPPPAPAPAVSSTVMMDSAPGVFPGGSSGVFGAPPPPAPRRRRWVVPVAVGVTMLLVGAMLLAGPSESPHPVASRPTSTPAAGAITGAAATPQGAVAQPLAPTTTPPTTPTAPPSGQPVAQPLAPTSQELRPAAQAPPVAEDAGGAAGGDRSSRRRRHSHGFPFY
ncbi:MAG: hypothetical protein HY909_13215 [Deltaproteobacteria bacterium]|nr:hypothetical protein [Deltaproteobacteria bacterium]